MRIEENVPLAPHTTFRLGGPARYFSCIKTVEELRQSLDFSKSRNLEILLLGGGSNLLISDAGFGGLVIKIEITGVEREGDTLIAGAGESWDALVAHTVAGGWWGLENLSGIPGTVGAAPVQNIGAYGAEIKDSVRWVEVLDRHSGEVVRMESAACGFGYRTSIFKRLPAQAGEPQRYVVLRVAFALKKDGTPNASYKDLAGITRLNLDEIRQKVLEVRSQKFPDLSKEGTAGSFFLNPVVSGQKAAKLLQKYPGVPQFAAENGVKVSLAWLLDNVLHAKGMREGGARLYERQPLVIVAGVGASARDVTALKEKIKKEVQEKLDIMLEEEVRVVGVIHS